MTSSPAVTPPAFVGPTPRKRSHAFATLVFAMYAALLPVERLFLADSSLSVLVWRGFLFFLVLCVLGRRAARPALAGVWLSGLILIPLAGALSGLTTTVANSFGIALQLALLCGLTPFVLRYYIVHSSRFIWVTGSAFVIAQSASATAGMMQLAGLQVFDTKLIFGRATGLAGHPNVLGIMSVIAVIIAVAALSHMPKAIRPLAVVTIILNGLTLVFSGSLSAMLAAAIAVLVALAIRRQIVLAFVAIVLSAVGIFIFASVAGLDAGSLVEPVGNRVEVVLGTSSVEGGAASIDTRILTYEWAWRFISVNPLVGVGMDPPNAGTYNGVTPVHNYVLHAWYRGGLFFAVWQVVATIGYATLVVLAIRAKRWVVPTAVLVAMVAFASTSAFYDQQPYWLPLLMAVACYPPSPRDIGGPVPRLRSGRAKQMVSRHTVDTRG